MIRFTLCCEKKHEFDGWFRSNADFDTQKERGLVTCPICHSPKVEKTLMAPNISTGRQQEKIALAMGEEQRMALEKLKEFARKARESADYVGERFAEEARKIHFGEVEPRGIYGEATPEEARQLIEGPLEFRHWSPHRDRHAAGADAAIRQGGGRGRRAASRLGDAGLGWGRSGAAYYHACPQRTAWPRCPAPALLRHLGCRLLRDPESGRVLGHAAPWRGLHGHHVHALADVHADPVGHLSGAEAEPSRHARHLDWLHRRGARCDNARGSGHAGVSNLGRHRADVYRTWDWPEGAGPTELAVGSHLASGLMLLGLAAVTGQLAGIALLDEVPGLALAQVASAAGMFVCYFRLQAVSGPVYLSQISYVAAAIAIISGTLLLGESYAYLTWIGTAIIFVGVVMTTKAQAAG
jgi:uncharacterized membrane protein